MTGKDFKAVESTMIPGRYIVVSTENGKTLDDANGYGFRTKTAACACYGWKKKRGL